MKLSIFFSSRSPTIKYPPVLTLTGPFSSFHPKRKTSTAHTYSQSPTFCRCPLLSKTPTKTHARKRKQKRANYTHIGPPTNTLIISQFYHPNTSLIRKPIIFLEKIVVPIFLALLNLRFLVVFWALNKLYLYWVFEILKIWRRFWALLSFEELYLFWVFEILKIWRSFWALLSCQIDGGAQKIEGIVWLVCCVDSFGCYCLCHLAYCS